MEDYIRGFRGVYGKPLSYGLMYNLEPPAAASDPMYHANGSNDFTHAEDMISRGPILRGNTVY